MRTRKRLVAVVCGAMVSLAALSAGDGAAVVSAAGAAGGYRALTPQRLLDTRQDLGASGPIGAGGMVTLDVTGVGGVPDSGVAAVVLNVTAVEATTGTYVTVWPTGQPQPDTSNLNVRPGVDTPNLVIATVGADGTVSLANQFGSVNLLADVTGWFPTGSDYQALTPQRLLDTRVGKGATGPVGPEGTISLDVTGVGGVPDTGVAAVVLNVTAVEATAGTYVTVWPTGTTKPGTSNLNVQPGVDTPNLVIATVGADGTVSLANQFGSLNLLADVTGWIPTGAGYHALVPQRLLDTRQDLGATGPIPAGGSVQLDVTGTAGVPDTGVAAVVLNVTAVEATTGTYVTVWPTGQPKPETSNLNVQPGTDTPNLVIATVGADGTIALANQFGTVNLIADITGWIPGTPAGHRGHLYYTGSDDQVSTVTLEAVDMTTRAAPVVAYEEGWSTGVAYNVNLPQAEFVYDHFDDAHVFIRDLRTGVLTAQFVWPDTYGADPWILTTPEVSPDGQLIIAEINHPDSSLVSLIGVVDRSGNEVLSLPDETFTEWEWLPNGDLLVAYEAPDGYPYEAAVGIVSRADLLDGGDVSDHVVRTFTANDLPAGLAVSHDGTQVAYQSGSGFDTTLSVLPLDGSSGPHQLTAPSWLGQGGFAFSPDGSEIALVLYTSCGAYSCAGAVHVVPNHRHAPIEPVPGGPTELHVGPDNATVTPDSRLFWGP